VCFGIFTMGYGRFAECQGHSTKPEKHSANSLPSVALGNQHTAKIYRQTFFAECFLLGTRQTLCRVQRKHSANIFLRKIKKQAQAATTTGWPPPPASGPGGAGGPWRARWPSSRCPSRGPRGLPRQSQWRDPVLLRRGRRARVDGGGGDTSVPV